MTVVLASLVIKTVPNLMGNHRADTSAVERIKNARSILGNSVEVKFNRLEVFDVLVVERRLENSRRETDFVTLGVIVCIDGLWGHEPLGLVLGGVDHIKEIYLVAKSGDLSGDLQQRVSLLEYKLIEVLPLVGEADFRYKGAQLFHRFFASSFGHPVKRFERGLHNRKYFIDERQEVLLLGKRKVLVHVELAKEHTSVSVDDSHGALL
mmetsp:Transcript_4319/g.8166  ORF Transcript_4319/g.8166 Transcript_4319/m.8166 type:complete len:208 (-) Transcript_4319:1238-1861(-)